LALLKSLALPQIQESELDDSLAWEASRHLPVDSSELNFDYRVLKAEEAGKPTEVLLAAAGKDTIARLTRVIRLAGLKPAVVEVDVNTIHNLYLHSYGPDDETVEAIMDIGASATKLILIRGASLLFTVTFPITGQEFLDPNLTPIPIEQNRLIEPPTTSLANTLACEVEKAFSCFRTTQDYSRVNSFFLCGGGSRIPGLPLMLSEIFDLPVHFLDPLTKLNFQNLSLQAGELDDHRARSALAIGLALRMTREG
jgi:type IV pilus assembly protein PilM